MNIPQVAADIAARIPEMAKDSPINNAHLIGQLLFHECAGCYEPEKECLELRRRHVQLEALLAQLREEVKQLETLKTSPPADAHCV